MYFDQQYYCWTKSMLIDKTVKVNEILRVDMCLRLI